MNTLPHQISLQMDLTRATPLRWAHDPISGKGAKVQGGRFNPVGVACLYLSFRAETTLKETGFGVSTHSTALQQISVISDKLIDLTDDTVLAAIGFSYDDMRSPNWEAEMIMGKVPTSHAVAMHVIELGYHGAVVPSFAVGATDNDVNLVLWVWGADTGTSAKLKKPQALPFKGKAVPPTRT